jgi:hypothetical protein
LELLIASADLLFLGLEITIGAEIAAIKNTAKIIATILRSQYVTELNGLGSWMS